MQAIAGPPALMQVKVGNEAGSTCCHVIPAWKEAGKDRNMTEAHRLML